MFIIVGAGHAVPQIREGIGTKARAATGGRPYEDDDSMDVVGHDGKPVDVHARIENRQFGPDRFYHLAGVVQLHLAVNNLAEEAGAGLGDDGDEIGPGLGVIVSLEADGMAVVFVRVVSHVHHCRGRPLCLPRFDMGGHP